MKARMRAWVGARIADESADEGGGWGEAAGEGEEQVLLEAGEGGEEVTEEQAAEGDYTQEQQ